jgi:AcrR family transcriptional regulator
MPPSPEPTRTRLIEAGARLFAERGIDNVSLREITRAGGARNTVALQHHFGDRDGLLHAIIELHRPGIEARRHEQLDQCAAAAPRVRRLAHALVLPLAHCLQDEGGRAFLQIFADLLNRPRPRIEPLQAGTSDDSMERWRRMVEPLMPAGATRVHRRFSAVLYTGVELARHARAGSSSDVEVVVPATVDVVAAILRAPLGSATSHAITRHDARS